MAESIVMSSDTAIKGDGRTHKKQRAGLLKHPQCSLEATDILCPGEMFGERHLGASDDTYAEETLPQGYDMRAGAPVDVDDQEWRLENDRLQTAVSTRPLGRHPPDFDTQICVSALQFGIQARAPICQLLNFRFCTRELLRHQL